MENINFREILDKLTIDFIPVYNLRSKEIYGYKIIKNFSKLGFEDNNIIYKKAYEEGMFEFFTFKIQEKSYKLAMEKGLINSKLFYTLRINYIEDSDFLFSSIKNLTSKFGVLEENLVYEIKEAKDWHSIDEILNFIEDDNVILFKETKENSLNMKIVEYLSPDFVEISDVDSLKRIKNNKNIESKIIFRLHKNHKYDDEELIKLGIDYCYAY